MAFLEVQREVPCYVQHVTALMIHVSKYQLSFNHSYSISHDPCLGNIMPRACQGLVLRLYYILNEELAYKRGVAWPEMIAIRVFARWRRLFLKRELLLSQHSLLFLASQ